MSVRSSVVLFVAVLSFAFAGSAHAATWFVAPGSGSGPCSEAAPCGSFDRAYDLAAPGDEIVVRGGTYGNQELSGDKGSSTPVTVRVAAGESVTVAGAFEVFADYARVLGPFHATSRFDVDDSDQSNPIVGVYAERIQAGPSLVENARDLMIKDSSFGGVNGRKPLQTGAWPTSHRVTFDGVVFHDAAPTDPEQHLECLTISGVQGITVRNSLFRRCGYFGILAGNGLFAGGAAGPRDLVLENNVFERTLCWAGSGGCPASGSEDSNPDTGQAPYSLMFGADPFDGVTIRNNLFETEPSVNKPSYNNARFVGNVGAHGNCVSGLTYRHNLFTDRTCGPSDAVAPGVLADYDADWRLTDPGSPAVGAGDPADSTAADRGGQARDGDPDAGPDELDQTGPPDTVAPTAPAGLTAAGSIGEAHLTWSASSDDAGVARYNVHRGSSAGFVPSAGNRIARPTGTSQSDTGLAAGDYHYVVTAEDAAGNVSAPSGEAAATVTADTTAPSVTLTAPTSGAAVSGTVDVTASASDEVGVAGVQLRLDGSELGAEDTAAPYSQAWDTRGVADGAYTLTAVARDAAGNQTTSTPVDVTVDNPDPPPTRLVAAYGFEEAAGSSVDDGSDNANAGTVSGAARSTAGRFGRALSFDGENDWVTVPDSDSLDLGDAMTLEAWVRPTTLSGWRSVLLKEHTGRLVYSLYAGSDTGGPAAAAYTESYDEARGTAAVATGAWTHLAATYNGGTLRLYVNGSETASVAASGPITSSSGALRLGGNALWDEWFHGLLDEVRVYQSALTASEIQEDMDAPVVAGTEAPSVSEPEAPPVDPGSPPADPVAQPASRVPAPALSFPLLAPFGEAQEAGPQADGRRADGPLRGMRVSGPRTRSVRICAPARRRCRQTSAEARFRLSRPGPIVISAFRPGAGRAWSIRRGGSRGLNVVRLGARALKRGSYVIRVAPAGRPGAKGRVVLRLRVLR